MIREIQKGKCQRLHLTLPGRQGNEGKPDEETEEQQPWRRRKKTVWLLGSQVKEIFARENKWLIMLSITAISSKLTKNWSLDLPTQTACENLIRASSVKNYSQKPYWSGPKEKWEKTNWRYRVCLCKYVFL